MISTNIPFVGCFQVYNKTTEFNVNKRIFKIPLFKTIRLKVIEQREVK